MTKIYSIFMTVALLAAGVAMTGCSNKDNNEPQEPAKVKTYKMSITASKSTNTPVNGPKKELGLNGDYGIFATWKTSEEVKVFKSDDLANAIGTLHPQSAGTSTTLLGDLTGQVNPGDELTLKFLSPNYTEQNGTLAYISANCDYATASVTVKSVDGGNITTTADANFANQQAIVKFTLQDKANSSAITPTSLVINDGTNDIASVTNISSSIYTENGGDGILYVAVPPATNVNLIAKIGDYYSHLTKNGANIANGQYYTITAKMATYGVNITYGTLDKIQPTIINNIGYFTLDKTDGVAQYRINGSDAANITVTTNNPIVNFMQVGTLTGCLEFTGTGGTMQFNSSDHDATISNPGNVALRGNALTFANNWLGKLIIDGNVDVSSLNIGEDMEVWITGSIIGTIRDKDGNDITGTYTEEGGYKKFYGTPAAPPAPAGEFSCGANDIDLDYGMDNTSTTINGIVTVTINCMGMFSMGELFETSATFSAATNIEKIVITFVSWFDKDNDLTANYDGWAFDEDERTLTWQGSSTSVTLSECDEGSFKHINNIESITFKMAE